MTEFLITFGVGVVTHSIVIRYGYKAGKKDGRVEFSRDIHQEIERFKNDPDYI